MQDDQELLGYQLPSILDEEEFIEEEPMAMEEGSFEENLAEILDETTLNKIAGRLLDDIEDDYLSRKDWEMGLKSAMEQLGLKWDAQKEFPFVNACGVYSQVMLQSITEFYAQAVAELLPIEGPVKEMVIGDVTEELEQKAKLIETFANYYFTQIATEFYPDFKKMLPWVGLTGSSFRKVYFDPILRRPTSKFFKAQDFVVNYATTSLANCWRMTEVVKMNAVELQRYMQMGIYRDIEISPIDESDDHTEFEHAIDRIEGMTMPAYDEKIDYELYECHTYLDMKEIETSEAMDEEVDAESTYRPYRVTLHKETRKVLSLYRNWSERDPDYKRNDYYVDYGYMDGYGFYKLGAAQMVGGLAAACTTLLRQYIDGMTLSNFPGGMHVKGMRLEDNNIRIGPTEFIPVDTGGLPIQQSIMLMPYKEPSPGINEMRKELEMAAGRIMGSANQQLQEFNATAPVGTTYALLDRINLVQSTVIRSLRDSMATEFKLFYKLFSETMPEEPAQIDAIGQSISISAADFSENIKIVPVADPHVTTKMQRLMRAQTIVDLSAQLPQLMDQRQAIENYIKEIKIPESLMKKLVPNREELPPIDPVTENMYIMNGKPVKAHIDQDHMAHRTIVQSLMAKPDIPPHVIAAAAAHDMEHQAFEFLIQIQQQMGMEVPQNAEQPPPEMQNQIAMMAAQVIAQQGQENQANQPPPPIDPGLVMMEDVKVKQMAVEQKAKSDEQKAQSDAFKVQMEYEAKMKALEVRVMEIEQKAKDAEMVIQAKAFEVALKSNSGMPIEGIEPTRSGITPKDSE